MTDEAAAKEEIEKTLAVMDGSLRVSPTKFPIRYVMQTISDGVRKVRCRSTPEGWDAGLTVLNSQNSSSGMIQALPPTRPPPLIQYSRNPPRRDPRVLGHQLTSQPQNSKTTGPICTSSTTPASSNKCKTPATANFAPIPSNSTSTSACAQ